MPLVDLPFDCGCENREEIMGAGNWQVDVACVVLGLLVVIVVSRMVKK